MNSPILQAMQDPWLAAAILLLTGVVMLAIIIKRAAKNWHGDKR